jgi:hypothetical protein
MTTYDWVLLIVEFLVLAIIAYETGKAGWRSRQNRRKRAEIYALLGRGHSLQGNPPSIHEIERLPSGITKLSFGFRIPGCIWVSSAPHKHLWSFFRTRVHFLSRFTCK